MKTTYVVISGHICAGKDELIDKLKERNILGKDLPEGEQVHYLSEAVNHDPDVLNGYYSDQKGIVIGNRHPLEARATFIRYGGEHDILDATAIGLHDIILRRGIEKNVIPIPDMVLYLDVADPEILIKRNQMRMAGGEENLAAQYLRDLAPYFARYRDHFQDIYHQLGVRVPKLEIIDSSSDKYQDSTCLERLAAICEQRILAMHRRRNAHP